MRYKRYTMFQGSFLLKPACALAMVFAGDVLFWHYGQTGGLLGLYELLLLMAALLTRSGLRHDRRATACMVLAALAAVAMIFNPGLLAWCLFWIFAGMGVLFPATARGDAWQWLQRLILLCLRSAVAPILDARRLLRIRRRRRRPGFRMILGTIAVPLAGGIVILGLFAMANPVLQAALSKLAETWPDLNPGRAMLWLALFFCAWSLLRARLAPRVLGTFDGQGDPPLPGLTPASILLSLCLFNGLFAMQNAMDLAWLWGLVPLPAGITLASYAHRGAYPLIATALLAAAFVLIALRPGSRSAGNPVIRRLVILWVAQNIVLVGNAALRTLDYIAAYSLTSLRIAALLWMGLVALGLVLIVWRFITNKSAAWLINANAAALLALLTLCGFVDFDALTSAYNIRHARELGGNGAPLDMCYLENNGASALLPLVELEQRPAPEAIHLSARLLRETVQDQLAYTQTHGDWSLLGAIRLATVRLKLRHAAPSQIHGPFECTNRDIPQLRRQLGIAAPEQANSSRQGA